MLIGGHVCHRQADTSAANLETCQISFPKRPVKKGLPGECDDLTRCPKSGFPIFHHDQTGIFSREPKTFATPFAWRLCRNTRLTFEVILNEVKNLIITGC